MKAIIWIGCLLPFVFIQAGFAGIRLGALPTVLLFAALSGAANALCKKWDENHRK